PIAIKLALTFTILIGIGMITLGFLVGSNQTALLEEQIDKFGNTLVSQMVETAREPLLANDHLDLELITNSMHQDSNIEGAAVFNDERVQVVKTGAVPPSPPNELFTGKRAIYEWGTPQQAMISYISPIVFRDVVVGYALLTFDHSVMNKAKEDTVTVVVSSILLMLLAAIAASLYLGKRLTRPIDQMMLASRAFSEGKFDYRITESRNDELGVLMQSLNRMGEGLLRKEQVEKIFSRYVSPQVARQAIADLERVEELELGGRHVEASVLFADIVGFTSLSETLSPQEISSLLNLYFSHIARAVHFCGGHIDKYMGDCAMIVFGVPEECDNHSFKAMACAWMILELVSEMNKRRRKQQLVPVEFRVGVNSGTMLAGNMGSTERMEYTVVGDSVNLASRLSHAGNPGEAILTEQMLRGKRVETRIATARHGRIQLRGKKEPVSIYQIIDILDPFREAMREEIVRIIESTEIEAA
ncbi:MAG TPA: adenylate/guanylate cyclase domain-containing protein, partial [Gammaproteobacteria bacterium]